MEYNEDQILRSEQQRSALREIRKLENTFSRHQHHEKEDVMHWMRLTRMQQLKVLVDANFVSL